MVRYILPLLTIILCCCSNPYPPYSWETDYENRLANDFSWTREQVKDYIAQRLPSVTDEQIDSWTTSGLLESRMSNGQRMYFKRTASNLFLLDSTCRATVAHTQELPKYSECLWDNIRAVCRDGVVKKRFRVTYTLTVKPDVIPVGQIIRCWLPFPQEVKGRQEDVTLLSSNYKPILSNDTHSSLYMQTFTEAGTPTVFTETFEYTSYGRYYPLEHIQPYDTTSEIYRTYTKPREAHVLFTPVLRQLADSLTRGITSPLKKVEVIYSWIDKTFPWAGAREYSTIPNIPQYVLNSGHGDCGQVTLLFITLCRIVGIPAHFQSGFWTLPGNENLHDWCEVYFEGVGWVPVDQSYGPVRFAREEGYVLDQMKNLSGHYFYLGGMDNYRLIVNQDFGFPLQPTKLYPRSEPVDFQRGEVEWLGGNLYFPLWDYHIDIQEL